MTFSETDLGRLHVGLEWGEQTEASRKTCAEILAYYDGCVDKAISAHVHARTEANNAYERVSMQVLSGANKPRHLPDDRYCIDEMNRYMDVVDAADEAGGRALNQKMHELFYTPVFGIRYHDPLED